MCKDYLMKIFKDQYEKKYVITKYFEGKLRFTKLIRYDNLLRVFLEGYEDEFFLVPSIPAYLEEVYGYNNIQEWFLEDFGKDEFEEFQKKGIKFNEEDVYIFLDLENGRIPEFEKYNGDILDTINKLFVKVYGYSDKNNVQLFSIDTKNKGEFL